MNNALRYDWLERPLEVLASRWRRRAWRSVAGDVLEVGVGTGRNFLYYPPGINVVCIDQNRDMVDYAARRAKKMGLRVDVRRMDLCGMTLPNDLFDTVVSTFVFCQVGNVVAGLREMARVCRPGGRVVLLEHVRGHGLLGKTLSLLDRITCAWGESFSRNTGAYLEDAGLVIERCVSLLSDVVVLYEARVPGGENNA